MVSFDLNKYQTLLDLNDEPSLETELEYVPYYWVSNYYEPINKKIIRTYKNKVCDNLDNIIENE